MGRNTYTVTTREYRESYCSVYYLQRHGRACELSHIYGQISRQPNGIPISLISHQWGRSHRTQNLEGRPCAPKSEPLSTTQMSRRSISLSRAPTDSGRDCFFSHLFGFSSFPFKPRCRLPSAHHNPR